MFSGTEITTILFNLRFLLDRHRLNFVEYLTLFGSGNFVFPVCHLKTFKNKIYIIVILLDLCVLRLSG